MPRLSRREQLLLAQFVENECRKDLTPSEKVAIARAIRPILAKQAAERKKHGRRSPPGEKGRTRDKVGKLLGVSSNTLRNAEKVVEAAEENPEKYGALVEHMDDAGRVDGAYRRLKQLRDAERIQALPVVEGKYRTIVIDPAWSYGVNVGGNSKPTYNTMTWDEIAALPVADWADEECHLYLWATNVFLPRVGELIDGWGFQRKTVLTWHKTNGHGAGKYFENVTEHVVFATRGKVGTRVQSTPTFFEAPRGRHSEKPDIFYDIVERASFPPYIDVFGRRERSGWTVWGDVPRDGRK